MDNICKKCLKPTYDTPDSCKCTDIYSTVHCTTCGKEINENGEHECSFDFITCTKCGATYDSIIKHQCNYKWCVYCGTMYDSNWKHKCSDFISETLLPQPTGWVCPLCYQANNPSNSVCPCVKYEKEYKSNQAS